MVLLIRTIHGLLSAFFLACIGFVYYGAIADVDSPLVYAAAGALILEGVVVSLNGGDCPLGGIHRRYGDEKAFFELLLPAGAAKLAVPVLGAVTALGIALVVVL
jgi:hypothetical protein